MKDLTGKPVSDGVTPKYGPICKRCGKTQFALGVYHVSTKDTLHRTFVATILCINCRKRLDRCKVYIGFNGIGSWQVLKSHVA